MNLTETQRQTLIKMQNGGTHEIATADANQLDIIETEPDEVPDKRGLSIGMCNAIREAAHDGHTYCYIADLFSFTDSDATIHKHAQGVCNHHSEESVPPIESRKNDSKLTGFDCNDLRRRFRNGWYLSLKDAANEYGVSLYTVRTHVQGDCNHNSIPAVDPPEYSGSEIREMRKSSNLTQRELAKMLDVQRSYISELENGKYSPRYTLRVLLATKLDQS